MGNKYPQTNEAKEKFNSLLLEFMKEKTKDNPNYIFTREDLMKELQYDDRTVRREMEKVANFYPIIATSDKKGYRLGSFEENTVLGDVNELLEDTNHTLNEIGSRIESLQARMKPLIAFKIILERKIKKSVLIFRKEIWEKQQKELGNSVDYLWPNFCDGKTIEECKKLGCVFILPEWCEEVIESL